MEIKDIIDELFRLKGQLEAEGQEYERKAYDSARDLDEQNICKGQSYAHYYAAKKLRHMIYHIQSKLNDEGSSMDM